MNRGELVTKIANTYLHRDDMNTDIEGFIDLATSRIGRDLRSQFNVMVDQAFTPDNAYYALPADYRAIDDISHQQGANVISLQSRTPASIRRYPWTGTALVYNITGLTIEIRPFQAKEYRLVYYSEPVALTVDSSENDVLTAYPYLYIYAALVEAHTAAGDDEARALVLSTYNSEVKEINTQTQRANTGARPSIR